MFRDGRSNIATCTSLDSFVTIVSSRSTRIMPLPGITFRFHHFWKPFRGGFHLSFTLLFRYRFGGIFRLAWRLQANSDGYHPILFRKLEFCNLRPYYVPITLFGRVFKLFYRIWVTIFLPITPHLPFLVIGLAYSVFVRHYLQNHVCFLFLLLVKCFTSERYRSHSDRYELITHNMSSHSGISGSKATCTSPELIASLSRPSSEPQPRNPSWRCIWKIIVYEEA